MSELVDYLRKEATSRGIGLTARQFAEAAGLSKTTAHWLLQGRTPRKDTLESVATNLQLPLAHLLRLAEIPDEGTPFVLPSDLNALPAEDRRVVITMGRALLRARKSNDGSVSAGADSP